MRAIGNHIIGVVEGCQDMPKYAFRLGTGMGGNTYRHSSSRLG